MIDIRPDISIIIPVYNAVETIEYTLRSLIYQNYPALELIVVDGGSNDGTVSAIEKYSSYIHHFISEKDQGQTDAINKGLRHASGVLVNWLCADDQLKEGALHTLACAYSASPNADVFIGHCERKFPDGTDYIVKPTPDVLNRIGYHNGIDQPACFWTGEIHRKCGELDQKYYHAMDWDWWNRLAMANANLCLIEETLATYYFPANSKTSTGGNRQMLEMYEVIKKYGPFDGMLANIYLHLYQNYDIKGAYDTPPLCSAEILEKRNFIIAELAEIFGEEYIYSYNWNFCSKQERNICWYK